MKRFIFMTAILLGLLWWFGLPSAKDSSSKQDAPYSFTSTSSSYQPWSNSLEKVHRMIYLREATAHQLKKQDIVLLDDIAPSLQQAVLTMEDRKFYSHGGFDIEGILRASLVNLQKGEVEEGASTITQQLAKNLFLSQDRSWSRKGEELAIALMLEKEFSKEEIFTLYLNSIYFGSNAYGIKEAAQTYFGKAPATLTLAQSAMLAGLPQAPSLYSPHVDFDLAQKRKDTVLQALLQQGLITPKQAREAKDEVIGIRPFP